MHEVVLQDLPTDAGEPVKLTLHLPSCWEEVTDRKQLLTISKAVSLSAAIDAQLISEQDEEEAESEPGIGRTVAKWNLFNELLELPEHVRSRLPEYDSFCKEVDTTDPNWEYAPVETSEIRFLPELDWCFEPAVFERSHMQRFEHGGTVWHGFDNGFAGMLVLRWLWSCSLSKIFREAEPANAVDALNNVMGALFHPEDAEAPWSNKSIEGNAARLADLPVEMKLAALLNFEAIHSTLPALYNRTFDPRGEAYNSPAGVFGLAFDVAKSGVLGTTKDVFALPLHEVLMYMEHHLFSEEREAKRLKETLKS